MRYLLTLEVNDPEGQLGDSPAPDDVTAWSRYLDLPDDPVIRLVKVEVA